ncbi:hypothetical protein L1887_40520 [Cichorium endivia]|nr:hypothetical protein L1887_40520 [Cichorium endivia]
MASGSSSPPKTAFVSFPGAEYTQTAAIRAARKVLTPHGWIVEAGESADAPHHAQDDSGPSAPSGKDLYLADYDLLPFEELLPGAPASAKGKQPQCSSYVIRKALIRKHYLASALNTYAVKLPPGDEARRFRSCTPKTWHLDIQFADELDELLMDDLYDLAELLEQNERALEEASENDVKWFILKPGMADRGNGIRIFSTLDQLQSIFEEFEPESDDEGDEDDDVDDDGEAGSSASGYAYAGKDTSVMASQLRHFVIQEYIRSPAPCRPYPLPTGRLFGKGGLTKAFTRLGTRLERAQISPSCLRAMCGRRGGVSARRDARAICTTGIRSAVFGDGARSAMPPHQHAAAKAGSIHWQMWPNAFEVFGVDLLVGYDDDAQAEAQNPSDFNVWLLETWTRGRSANRARAPRSAIEKIWVAACSTVPTTSSCLASTDRKIALSLSSRLGDVRLAASHREPV